jgi:site-specific recombinase
MRLHFLNFRQLWRREAAVPPLDLLLSLASPSDSLEIRLNWLVDMVDWVRCRTQEEPSASQPRSQLQTRRLRRLFDVLDRNLEWKRKVAQTLRSIVRETQAVDLFSEVGLPRQFGLVHELGHRLTASIVPPRPDSTELGVLFDRLFPHSHDERWVQGLEEDVLQRLGELLAFEIQPNEKQWNTLSQDLEDALVHLAAQVQVSGCSSPIRLRLGCREIRELPFFKLGGVVQAALVAHHQTDPAALAAELNYLRSLIEACSRSTAEVLAHLEDNGVSTDVVYQVAYIEASLNRMESLMDAVFNRDLPLTDRSEFVAKLVRENHARRSLGDLLRRSFQLLTRKMVERNAETGEHYVARTPLEYRDMLHKGAGGGLLMSLTAWVKIVIFSLQLPGLMQGLAAAINYSVGFVAIQLAGCTLATKQPATTAPALAARLHGVMDPQGRETFVDEVVCLIRSQFAAVVGNVGLVIPPVILWSLVIQWMSGAPMMTEHKAVTTLQSLSITGPSWFYAAFTGVLLCSSSLFGAWAENWFAYHQLASALKADRRLARLVGPTRAGRLAGFLKRNVAGFASNVSLAFMLGILPEFAAFAGVPLDVRHVTLSSGFLAAAVASLGPDALQTWSFWLAVAGLVAIGLMNVLVSFSLAMFVAIRARAIQTPERHAIYRVLLQRLNRQPLSFLVPI